MPKSESKKARLKEYLDRAQPAQIGDSEWNEIARELAPVSQSYLRTLLRASGVPLDPLIEGVRQETLADLERTLQAIGSEYEPGDSARRQRCRECVIASKDHTRFAIRRMEAGDARRAEKDEMLLWMLTWLENPPSFPVWVSMRKRVAGPRE